MNLNGLFALVTWGSTFKDSPDGSDSPTQGDDKIRETREAVQERIRHEHYTVDDGASNGTTGQDWWHRPGSAKMYYQSTAPTGRPDVDQTAFSTLDNGRLWLGSDDDTVYVYTGSTWSEILGATTYVQMTGAQTIAGAKTFSVGATFTLGLSAGDANITNVADIALDSISADGSTISISLDDNTAAALDIKESTNSYLKFDTTDGSELVTVGKALTVSGAVTLSSTLDVTDVATFTAQPILSSLTASQAVFTDASKGLVSNAITGTGNVVMSASPTLTGTITAAAATFSGTVQFNGTTNIYGSSTLIGNATSDNVAITARISSHLVPYQDDTYDLGATTLEWKDLYIDGVAYIDTLTAQGNATIGGTLGVTGVTTLTAQPILSSLTASRAVFTDASKGLVSNAVTGTGNVVMSASPTLTGTITAAAANFSGAVGVGGDLTVNEGAGETLTIDTSLGYTVLSSNQGDFVLQPGGGYVRLHNGATEYLSFVGNATSTTIACSSTNGVGINGDVAFNSNVTIGNAATDTVTVTADVASNLIPSADDTYDLGASGSEWKDLYIDGTANIDVLSAGNTTITGNLTFDSTTLSSLSTGTTDNDTLVTKGYVDDTVSSGAPAASETTAGLIEIATDAEAVAAASDILAITPVNLTARLAAPGAIGGTTAAAGTFTNVTVDDLELDGTTISTTSVDANLLLRPNGDGNVSVDATNIGLGYNGSAWAEADMSLFMGSASHRLLLDYATGANAAFRFTHDLSIAGNDFTFNADLNGATSDADAIITFGTGATLTWNTTTNDRFNLSHDLSIATDDIRLNTNVAGTTSDADATITFGSGATINWDTSDGDFEFSHQIDTPSLAGVLSNGLSHSASEEESDLYAAIAAVLQADGKVHFARGYISNPSSDSGTTSGDFIAYKWVDDTPDRFEFYCVTSGGLTTVYAENESSSTNTHTIYARY